MAWIESHDNIGSHPKTKRAARMLEVSIPAIVGHLHLLWHWCLTYAEDGNLSDYDTADIADAAMWEGDPDKFVDVLINCGPGSRAGFLTQESDGQIVVHDWLQYAGRLLESRQAKSEAGSRGAHERWHVQRGVVDPDCPHCQHEVPEPPVQWQDSTSIAPPLADASHSDNTEWHRTVPNRTQPNTNVPVETDIGSGLHEDAVSTPDTPSVRPSVDDPLSIVTAAYHAHIGTMGPSQFESLRYWHDDMDMPPDVMVEAILEAKEQGKTRINYVEGILRNWHNDGVRTVEDARERRQPRDRPKSRSEPVYLSALDKAMQLAEQREVAQT